MKRNSGHFLTGFRTILGRSLDFYSKKNDLWFETTKFDNLLFNKSEYKKTPYLFDYLKFYDAFVGFNKGLLCSQREVGTVLYYYFDPY